MLGGMTLVFILSFNESEAAVCRCFSKKRKKQFLKVSQYLQGNT